MKEITKMFENGSLSEIMKKYEISLEQTKMLFDVVGNAIAAQPKRTTLDTILESASDEGNQPD